MKVVFLDRDGVINIDKGYVHKIKDFEYTYKCKAALSNILRKGYEIIIVTNQSGIARGLYTKNDYNYLTKYYLDDLKQDGINILDVFYCPHHIEGTISKYSKECFFRKPNPGMINESIKKYSINKSESFLVGDKKSDIDAGANAGIKNLTLIESPYKEDQSTHSHLNYKDLFSFSISRDLI